MTLKFTKRMTNIKKYALLGIVMFSVLAFASFKIFRSIEDIPQFSYLNQETFLHGPLLNEKSLASGYFSKTRNKKTSNTTSTSTSTSTTTATTATTTIPFGVAAGGSLTSLSQVDLDAYFQALRDLGAGWVRWDIDWSVVQQSDFATYDWSGPDRVAATAQKYGIKSLAIIAYSPHWAAKSDCVLGMQCAPQDPAAFAAFSSVAATRYKGIISYWEIWNEPNIPQFWSPKPDVGEYSTLLKASYQAIKTASPDAVVLTGGLSPAADNSTTGSIAPSTFVRGFYANGAQGYFDAIALHPYTYPASPDYVADWNSWQQIAGVRDIMISAGDGTKKIWLTEYGAPTGGSGTAHDVNQLTFTYGSDFMSETAQKTLASQVLNDYLKMTDWTGPMFWYGLRDNGTSLDTPENFFGLLRYDGSKKPAYDTIKSIISPGTI